MNTKTYLTNILIVLGFFSCNPKINTTIINKQPALEDNAQVFVYEKKEAVPNEHQILGQVYVGDTGFSTNCSLPVVMDAAKKEARKIGGNSLLITQHLTPNLMSSCHRINANILSVSNELRPKIDKELVIDNIPTKEESTNLEQYRSKWRIAFQGGYSYRTAKIIDGVSSDYGSYLKKLKNGFHLGGDIAYFPKGQDFGLGIKYNYFSAKNSGDFYFENDNGNIEFVHIKDDIKINFIGPSFLIRYPSKQNLNAAFLGISLGYMSYADEAVLFDELDISGHTFGAGFDFGYDIATSDKMAIGFQISFMGGVLHKIAVDDGQNTEVIELGDDSKESLARLDFSIGIRF